MSLSCCPNGTWELVILVAGGSSSWAWMKELNSSRGDNGGSRPAAVGGR